MMSHISAKFKLGMNLFLFALVVLDVVLSSLCFFAPETWFQLFHGADYVDPQGLLRRTGALWVAFSLFQFIALLKWTSQPYWLPLVAGIRLTEVFSDWTYIYFAESVTWYGKMGLFIAPPGNIVFAVILIKAYLCLQRED